MAPSCKHHASNGGSKVGTKARLPSPSWEHSTGPLQLQKLPGGLPRASVTIVLWVSVLLGPLLIFLPLAGAVLGTAPQKSFCRAAYTCMSKRLGLGNRGTKCLASEDGLMGMNFIEETESSHLAFRAPGVLFFPLCVLICLGRWAHAELETAAQCGASVQGLCRPPAPSEGRQGVWGSCGCRQMCGLKLHKCILSQRWRPEGWNQGAAYTMFFLKAPGETAPRLSLSFWCVLAGGCSTLSPPLPLHGLLHPYPTVFVQPFPHLKKVICLLFLFIFYWSIIDTQCYLSLRYRI